MTARFKRRHFFAAFAALVTMRLVATMLGPRCPACGAGTVLVCSRDRPWIAPQRAACQTCFERRAITLAAQVSPDYARLVSARFAERRAA